MSKTTYQIYSNKNIQQSLRSNHHEYDINPKRKEKDMLISQLKAKIFELELHEKDYDLLYERYKQLENEFNALNDCMHNLECEKKIRDDEIKQHINELQSNNENLQIGFNEKLSNNKDLFSKNNILGKQLELIDSKIFNLKNKIKELETQIGKNEEGRANLGKILNGLIDINNSQNLKISQLFDDNKTLKQICEAQDLNIKDGNQERNKLAWEVDIKNNNIQDLNYKIKAGINNLNNLENQYNKNNSLNIQYQNNIKDLEKQANSLKEENNNLKNNLIKEKSIRTGESQKNSELTNTLNKREQKINLLCNDIDNIKIMQDNASNQKLILHEENSKLRDHIMSLSEINQNLISEIHIVIEEDEKKISIINRKDRISSLLMNNRSIIDQSLNNLDEGINRGEVLSYRASYSNNLQYN